MWRRGRRIRGVSEEILNILEVPAWVLWRARQDCERRSVDMDGTFGPHQPAPRNNAGLVRRPIKTDRGSGTLSGD